MTAPPDLGSVQEARVLQDSRQRFDRATLTSLHLIFVALSLKVCWTVCFFQGQKKDRHSSPVGRSHGCLFLRSKSETGPSHRRAQNASAALRIFVRHPRKTFATVSATCGLTRRSKQRLVDHLVGADEERLRHGKAERLRRLQVDHELAHILLKETPKALRGGRSDNKNADGAARRRMTQEHSPRRQMR